VTGLFDLRPEKGHNVVVKTAPLAAAADASASVDRGEGRTREAVSQLLLSDGPLTAADLAGRLGISPAAVRRHLDQLIAEGAVTSRQPPSRGQRGRGRPARSYLLTDVGRGRLPHQYDDLAIQALDYLQQVAGPESVTEFARRRAEAIVEPFAAELDSARDLPERAGVLAKALTAAGFSASLQEVGVGQQLCQHHCPVGHVAAEYPQLCEEEMAVFTRALGSYAQRLATIARGDPVCTTFIPLSTIPPPRPAVPSAT
jgi:predicted ArsR family transcriptional regulator